MGSCHAAAAPTSPTLAHVLAELQAFIAQRSAAPPATDLGSFERELHARVLAVEREVLASELRKFDVDVPVVTIDGEAHRRVLRCKQTYWGVAGPVEVERTLYSTRQGDRARCPLELRAGIVDRRWTPWAAQQAAWVVAHLTPQEGEDLFAQFGGLAPSKSSLDRLPKVLSERWEAGRVEWEEALRREETVPAAAVTVAVSLDGVLVPMKDGDRVRKRAESRSRGKRTKGPAGYCEAGCATLTFYDAAGERLETRRAARMPEHKKATLKVTLEAELDHVLSQRPDLTLVKVADGARDNWDYFSRMLPEGIEVVDFYHVAEHLRLALSEAYGETSPRGLAQFEKLRHVLLEDRHGVDKVIRALRHLRDRNPRRKRIQTELTYFRRNRDRMRYADLKAAHLPIGSGVTEAACKTLVTQRLKRSGMRWAEHGGQAILTLRSLLQSNRFDRGWAIILATYRAAVTIPENVIAFRSGASVSA
jgi:hypothetical protein